jgi:hypothetical protein
MGADLIQHGVGGIRCEGCAVGGSIKQQNDNTVIGGLPRILVDSTGIYPAKTGGNIESKNDELITIRVFMGQQLPFMGT